MNVPPALCRHLPRRRLLGNLAGQVDQHVGLLAHGADDHHHLMALLLRADRLAGGAHDLFTGGDAAAAELLDDERHFVLTLGGSNFFTS